MKNGWYKSDIKVEVSVICKMGGINVIIISWGKLNKLNKWVV